MTNYTPDDLNRMSLEERKAALDGPFGRAFHVSAAAHATWIFWTRATDEPTEVLDQGSCFILDRGNGPMLVTAAHVYRGYLRDLQAHGALYCQVANARVNDLSVNLIACGNSGEADIATFRLPPGAADRIGKKPIIAWHDEWPAPPRVGENVMFVGFPGNERLIEAVDAIDFGIYSAMTGVTSITDHQISCRFDRRFWRDAHGTGLPPVGYGLGGISGGPLLVPNFKDGEWLWRLGGVISEAPPERAEQDVLFESVVCHRAEYIQADGSLARMR